MNILPKRRSAKKIVSRVLIITGAACILFAAAYEAIGYPWQILFKGQDELNADSLPDPSPPNVDYIVSLYEDWEPPQETDEPELPGADDGYLNLAGPDTASSLPPITLLGWVKVPKLEVSVNLLEGTGTQELLVGAGHVRSTPAVGAKGNCVIAGHRVTRVMHPFRHLDKMKEGDLVVLENDMHTYTYSAVGTPFAVKNTENWVMGEVKEIDYCLTIVTCHPVGSARERLILRCKLIDIDGMSPEAFYARPSPSRTPTEEDTPNA